MREIAYLEIRQRLRENQGKLKDSDKTEIEQKIVDLSGNVREEICKDCGIKVEDKDEYYTILQKCYFEFNTDPEFTNQINEARNEHIFILHNIMIGEIIEEISMTSELKLKEITDEHLDELNKKIIEKLSK